MVSLERIRSLLESRAVLSASVISVEDQRPIFRSRTDEKYWALPSLASRFRRDYPVPPPGTMTRWEINRLTRPGTYPGMDFAGVNVLPAIQLLMKEAKKAWERYEVKRVREEIRREIAAIEEANRRRASEIKTPDS